MPEATDRASSAIVGGARDDGSPPKLPLVGQLHATIAGGLESHCTATIVACGAAVTAGHCVKAQTRESSHGAIYLEAEVSETLLASSDRLPFNGFILHPEFHAMGDNPSAWESARDIAVLKLVSGSGPDWAARARARPMARFDGSVAPTPGNELMLVGYGWGAQSGSICNYEYDETYVEYGDLQHRWHRRWADTVVSTVGGASLLGRITFSAAEPGVQVAEGDSGGPLLMPDGVTFAGVLSARGSSACSSPTGYAANLTEPSTAQWLQDTPASLDRDDDGASDVCDSCPDTPDDGTDSDGDSIPDACDNCPCDPNESNPWIDADADGICGWCDGTLSDACAAACGGVKKPIDGCPGGKNPIAMSDCNAAVEQARGARHMPNACDPVPCARVSASHDDNVALVGYRPVTDGYVIGHEATYQSELSSLTMRPIGSHGSPDLADQSKRGVEVPVLPEWTEYRYCVHVFPHVDCRDPAHVRDPLIRARANRLEERNIDPWHRPWIADLYAPGEPFPDGSGWTGIDNPTDSFPYESGISRTRTWRWWKDFAYWNKRWSSYPALPTDLPPPGEPGGRFLAHAQTDVGMTPADQNPLGTGVHGMATDFTSPADSLANHVRYLWPIARYTTVTYQHVSQWDPGFLARLCLECPIIHPIDRVDTCSACGAIIEGPDLSLNEAQQVVLVRTATGTDPVVLLHDGSVVPIQDSIGQNLAQSLASGLAWVSAAEPEPMSGVGGRLPAALGLSQDGTQLVEKVFLSGRRALGVGDIFVDGPPIDSMAAPQAGPVARDAFQAVYSRATGTLFVVGGKAQGTGQPTRDIWWRNVDGGSWQDVPLPGWKPDRVLAATFSPVDQRLWVLHETGPGHHRRARIVRVRPGTGEAQVFGSWPRAGLFDRHWLVIDRDGSILVVASSDKRSKHAVVRIVVSADGDLRVEAVRVAKGTLAMAPVVDGEGYSFSVTTGPTTLPRVVRLASLRGKHGQWGDVGHCFG